MASESTPPYYEVVRLTHPTDDQTLKACVAYRRTPPPEMSLSWLRHCAYQVLSGQMTLAALENAIKKKLPANARKSVYLAVANLVDFAIEKDWIGERLPAFNLEVGRSSVMPVRAVGRFHSATCRWVVDLQPRLDHGPDLVWQMQTWLALLNEAYCTDPLARAVPLVLDVSRDEKTKLRGFHPIDPDSATLIAREELNGRMNRFLDCYQRAIEIVPVRPRRRPREQPVSKQMTLPGMGGDL